MRQLVESLKRLYKNEKVDRKKIIEMFEDGLIAQDERDYILKDE